MANLICQDVKGLWYPRNKEAQGTLGTSSTSGADGEQSDRTPAADRTGPARRLRREHVDNHDGEQSRGRREVLARVTHDITLGLPARQRTADLQEDRGHRSGERGHHSSRNRLHKASTPPDNQRTHQTVGHHVQQREVSGEGRQNPPRSGGGTVQIGRASCRERV